MRRVHALSWKGLAPLTGETRTARPPGRRGPRLRLRFRSRPGFPAPLPCGRRRCEPSQSGPCLIRA
jgi:hypothetical protein